MKHAGPVLLAALLIAVPLAGCLEVATGEASAALNRVTTHGTGVGSTVHGYANFTQRGDEVHVRVEVFGLTSIPDFQPGPKGTHIHENGDCGPAWDGQNVVAGGRAGGHFNPDNASHPHHAGDLGNMVVDEDGHGLLEVTVTNINLGSDATRNVVGLSVVVHAGEDDMESQPAGDAGPRMLCGVIRSA